MLLTHQKVFRFLIAGTVTSISMFGFLYLLHQFFHIWYLLSSALAFLLTLVISFGLHKFWTFKDHSTDMISRQFYLFFFLSTLNFFINIALMYVLVDVFSFWYLLAQFVTTGLIALESFIFYHHVIFPARS